ncbi:J domain-containing protein [Halostella salina]|uniref:J domain-containing protein n=1 Tax=Halostella salina TaxID=1547897 RepID=UPI000EF7DBCB|nr:J domain-containing protein [Halostella salina]
MTHDFYDLLGVPDDASQDEIKDAFRQKVQEVHPDLNDDPRAPAQFTALKKGYDTLKDPVERKAYDRLGHKDYVAKRLEGLPDPEQWKPADADEGSTITDSTTGGSTTTGSSVGGSGATSTGTTSASSAGTTSSTGSATDGAGSAASASTGSNTSTRTNTGTRTSTGGSTVEGTHTGTTSTETTGAKTTSGGTTAGSDASTGDASTTTSTDTSASTPGLVERLRSINYGWPVVFLTSLIYLAGVGLYARGNAAGLREFASAVSAAGTDTAALREAALTADYGLGTVFDFVRTTAVTGGRPGAGVLVAIGTVALPAIFFVVVRTTRRSFAWQPTYLYVVAVLMPLVGLAANAGGVEWPALTVAAFGLFPLLAVVALPFNAFVTPRLKRLF